ncbi:type I-C CRISPR-associated protein Cas8c/Csd1 [Verrucomicrobiaceae bacterium R5-34]|nr:type I-C CRISPR-associated protein Cas8c/Csd1 [Verrucomicrobiaceae bacterium R5-34]
MNWLESLSQTYDNCTQFVGIAEEGNDNLLLPLSHTTQNAQIEVTLDHNAKMISAKLLPKKSQKTLVPCTEASGGRAGSKPTSHPLCDKLQYLAGDFLKYGGQVTSGFAKEPEEPFQEYTKLLTNWQTHSPHPKVKVILDYVIQGRLIKDLIHHKIIPVINNSDGSPIIHGKWDNKEIDPPEIYAALATTNTPQDAFVRWAVTIPEDKEPHLWKDSTVWESWNNYYRSTQEHSGLCYVSGEIATLAIQHPAKLRHAADKAKLISANDSSGFTFRGRFTDKDGLQTCGLSFDITQKAHNALRWLIARQGKKYGDQAIVAWAINGKPVPDALVSTASLFDDDEFESSEINLANSPLSSTNTGQVIANALAKKLSGYRADLGDTSNIIVLSLDAATPGRMAISYYRELTSSEFLQRVETWHSETAWPQNFSREKKFIGAPSPLEIAQTAYGRRLDDSLKAATHRRLLPCIIENQPLPLDLVTSCIHRATNRLSQDHWEWEKALGIACSLYRKQQIQTKNNHYNMSLERDRTTRSYLYGRLLAVADVLEETALKAANENRDTNAARLMQRFASRPYDTWQSIYLSLDPYRRRLKANSPGLLHRYEAEIEEIKNLFVTDDFCSPDKLEGEFLLAFHCQRTALFQKKEPITTPEED